MQTKQVMDFHLFLVSLSWFWLNTLFLPWVVICFIGLRKLGYDPLRPFYVLKHKS